MRLANHFKMGKLIYETITAADRPLYKALFVFGNLAPDLFFSFIYRPHFRLKSEKFFDKLLQKLYNDGAAAHTALFSFRLGKMTHYICDFFCYAHTPAFPGDLRDHAVYERMQTVTENDILPFSYQNAAALDFQLLVSELNSQISAHESKLSENIDIASGDVALAMQAATWAATSVYLYVQKHGGAELFKDEKQLLPNI